MPCAPSSRLSVGQRRPAGEERPSPVSSPMEIGVVVVAATAVATTASAAIVRRESNTNAAQR